MELIDASQTPKDGDILPRFVFNETPIAEMVQPPNGMTSLTSTIIDCRARSAESWYAFTMD